MQKFYVMDSTPSEPGTPINGDPQVSLAPIRTSVPVQVPLKELLRTARRQRMMHADKPQLAEQLDRRIADLVSAMSSS